MYLLKDAKTWEDVEEFKRQNKESLTPSASDLVRQFYGKGEIDINRVHGDRLEWLLNFC